MIADIQSQEVVSVSLEKDVQFTIVQDIELVHVGGGTSTCYF